MRAPGLDGVRALAVLAVMGFHEGASGLSGGFLGVDIFFVLSGFLITDLLVTRYDETGRLSLADFWARRARRLLPALAVMLVAITAAATIIEPGREASLRPALLAAATYASNWYQILHRVSYFAASGQFGNFGAPPPLDHLWSLAIEEQFYLVWPLILWFVIARLTGRAARVAAALAGAAASALVMALQYTPGGDPSAVYYGTDTHASALLIGAALALACPVQALVSIPAAQTRRLDVAGIAGLVVLAWATGHFSGRDPVVYPVGLLLAALGAGALVAAAACQGVIAALTSWGPLRSVGIRSYGIYLWHWPVIALSAALAGPESTSPWLWLAETGATIALASASWRFIETPVIRNGLGATVRHWGQALAEASRRRAGTLGRAVPVTVAAAAAVTFAVAGYGIARPPAPAAPNGLLRQVANGERVSAASQSTQAASAKPAGSAPSPAPSPPVSPAACRRGQPRVSAGRVSGGQVTAVGDSVMLASASALEAKLPGIYIDAQVGRQMQAGLTALRTMAAGAGSGRSSWSAWARTETSPPASSGSCSGSSGQGASSSWSTRSARSRGSTRSTRRSTPPPGTARTSNWRTGTGPSRPDPPCSGRTASTRGRGAPASTRASCSRRSEPGCRTVSSRRARNRSAARWVLISPCPRYPPWPGRVRVRRPPP